MRWRRVGPSPLDVRCGSTTEVGDILSHVCFSSNFGHKPEWRFTASFGHLRTWGFRKAKFAG